jgi:UDP-3-O-[3-hydroxymyristoyl] N-acetylglucosamine deacetylase
MEGSNVLRHSHRHQRTIARPVEVAGVGFLTGATVRLRFLPATPSSGVVLVRTDLPGHPTIAAHVSQVTGTRRRTTLGHAPEQVGLVEHVLASLAGLRIDNCRVELNAPEPPGLDGSAGQFVEALLGAGVVRQNAPRSIYHVEKSVVLSVGGASLGLHPADSDDLMMTYFLDYGRDAYIPRQVHTQTITPTSFINELAQCRTFILESEADELRRQGLGSRTTAADLLVFGPHGPIDNELRFADEPARHKMLDMVGDLSLLGADLCGHVVAHRSGHPLNVELVRELDRLIRTTAGRGAA